MIKKSNKKNLIAKDLFTKKYKPKIIKPKKGKDSYHNAQKKLKNKKEVIKKADNILENKQNIFVEEELDDVPPNIKEAVQERPQS